MREPIQALDRKTFDVLIIGGGINGAGAAQQLAAAGFSTVLLEKGDFGAATTSRSSRLLHCGMAYFAGLAYVSGSGYWNYLKRSAGAVWAARRAMRGRTAFVRESPGHLRGLDLYYVLYDDHKYKSWQLDLGFRLLKRFESRDVPLKYKRFTNEEATRSPILRELRDPSHIAGIFQICEYQFNWPERICVDAIMDAQNNGAIVRNYSQVVDLRRGADNWAVTVQDFLQPDVTARLSAKYVINAGGPWIDAINGLSGRSISRKVQPVRGTHIYLRLPPACKGQSLVTFNREGESIYCIAWGDGHYFGYTVNPIEKDLDDLVAPQRDVDELVAQARELFPTAKIGDEQLLAAWSGAAPQTFDEHSAFGVTELRLHDLADDGLPNLMAITSGNIMTHRQTALSVRRRIERVLSPSRGSSRKVSYRPRHPESSGEQSLVDAARLEHVVNLDDLLFRRTGQAWSPTLGIDTARRAAQVVAPEMNWSVDEIETQVARYTSVVDRLRARSS